MDEFAGTAVGDIETPLRVGHRPERAADARTSRVWADALLLLERHSIIGRTGHVDGAELLADLRSSGLPKNVNVSFAIGGDASAAFERFGFSLDAALRLERGPLVVQARIIEGRSVLVFRLGRSRFALRFARRVPIPDDVHAPIFPNGDLPAPHRRSRRHQASRPAIHANRRGERLLAWRRRV